jgi:hypothetical protein
LRVQKQAKVQQLKLEWKTNFWQDNVSINPVHKNLLSTGVQLIPRTKHASQNKLQNTKNQTKKC